MLLHCGMLEQMARNRLDLAPVPVNEFLRYGSDVAPVVSCRGAVSVNVGDQTRYIMKIHPAVAHPAGGRGVASLCVRAGKYHYDPVLDAPAVTPDPVWVNLVLEVHPGEQVGEVYVSPEVGVRYDRHRIDAHSQAVCRPS